MPVFGLAIILLRAVTKWGFLCDKHTKIRKRTYKIIGGRKKHSHFRFISIHSTFTSSSRGFQLPGHEEYWAHLQERVVVNEEPRATKSTGQKVPRMGESTTKNKDELLLWPTVNKWPSEYKSGKFRKNSHISSNQYCSISPAFSHLHVKFYYSSDPLLGSRNYFLLHFVNSSVKQGSVGSFPFFAAMNKIVQLVHS